ncbi:MAG: PaaI family thioesterase [Nitrospiria bacterium]
MTPQALNKTILPDNNCFGCGHDNHMGLKIEVTRDPENQDRLVGNFTPENHMCGFPGIVHGGAIYTALDCLASWTPTILRPEIKAAWILRSSEMKYLHPSRPGKQMSFISCIFQDWKGKKWAPLIVKTEARDETNRCLVEGQFKVVPLPAEKFKKVAGMDRLPENWRSLLNSDGR